MTTGNRIRELWDEDRTVLNGWLSIPSAITGETMARQPWDSLTIDLQHGMIGYESGLALLQAISTSQVVPLVRVSALDPPFIGKMLDAGALGIVCPMIQSREDVEALVRAVRYPPAGQRSFGPTRAALVNGPQYPEEANDTILAIAMIETLQAVKEIDDIVDVPGLDALYIGPADLSLSLGYQPTVDTEEPEVLDAITRVIEAAKARNKNVGIHCLDPSYAARMADLGARIVTLQSDIRLLVQGAQTVIADFWQARAGESEPGRD